MKYGAYVNKFLGVDDGGNCLCGPYLPNSMMRLGPDTIAPQTTSGYLSHHPIIGFSHMHVSGTGGGGRYGNVSVIPYVGYQRLNIGTYDRKDETADVGSYAVTLMPAGIRAELTVTERVALRSLSARLSRYWLLFHQRAARARVAAYRVFVSGLVHRQIGGHFRL